MNKKAVIEYVDYGRAIGVLLDLARDYGDMDECTEETIKMCIRALNRLPTLTPESLVKRGRWDNIPNRYMSVASKNGSYSGNVTSCSVCREINPNAFKTNFCPNCGAKMVED